MIPKSFQSFVRRLGQITQSGRGLWLTLVAALVSAVFVLLGLTLGEPHASLSAAAKQVWLVGKLAELVLSAIVVGAVLKVLVVEGFFQTALAEMLSGDSWIDSLSKERRVELWHRLTQKIYLPMILQGNKTNDETEVSQRDFHRRVNESVANSFDYRRGEYNRSVNLELTIDWADSAESRICIKKDAEFWLVPIETGAPAEWVFESTPEPHMQPSEYLRSTLLLKIDGELPVGPPNVKKRGHSERTTYHLSGKAKYWIEHIETLTWSIAKDPTFMRTSMQVVDGFQLRIENKAVGLRIVFVEIGGEGLFNSVAADLINSGEVMRRSATRVVLPGQGFQLVLIKSADGPDVRLVESLPESATLTVTSTS